MNTMVDMLMVLMDLALLSLLMTTSSLSIQNLPRDISLKNNGITTLEDSKFSARLTRMSPVAITTKLRRTSSTILEPTSVTLASHWLQRLPNMVLNLEISPQVLKT